LNAEIELEIRGWMSRSTKICFIYIYPWST